MQLSTIDKLRINIQLDRRGTQRETPSIAFIDSVFLFRAMVQLFNPEFAVQPGVRNADRLWTRYVCPKKSAKPSIFAVRI
jgi:hypothetical protein